MELNVQRITLAKQILNEQDEEVLNKMLVYFKKVKKNSLKPPCLMTVEELQTEVEQAAAEYKNGLYTTQEELEKQMELW
ncbi:MAG: hypothetical protein LBI65_00845 [Candidatus Symbiothrix sp.]|jgi:hypothetical protein|nr:hypothetical protein [Candidatus Symbiothrix sp.]